MPITNLGEKRIGEDFGDVSDPTVPQKFRILGLELHYRNFNGQRELLGLIPLNVVDLAGLASHHRGFLEVIVHTNIGQVHPPPIKL